jgi:hypothetical protein
VGSQEDRVNNEELLTNQEQAVLAWMQANTACELAQDQAILELANIENEVEQFRQEIQALTTAGRQALEKKGLGDNALSWQISNASSTLDNSLQHTLLTKDTAYWKEQAHENLKALKLALQEYQEYQAAKSAVKRTEVIVLETCQLTESAGVLELRATTARDAIAPVRRKRAAAYYVYLIERACQDSLQARLISEDKANVAQSAALTSRSLLAAEQDWETSLVIRIQEAEKQAQDNYNVAAKLYQTARQSCEQIDQLPDQARLAVKRAALRTASIVASTVIILGILLVALYLSVIQP